jgi:hypothetical protein
VRLRARQCVKKARRSFPVDPADPGERRKCVKLQGNSKKLSRSGPRRQRFALLWGAFGAPFVSCNEASETDQYVTGIDVVTSFVHTPVFLHHHIGGSKDKTEQQAHDLAVRLGIGHIFGQTSKRPHVSNARSLTSGQSKVSEALMFWGVQFRMYAHLQATKDTQWPKWSCPIQNMCVFESLQKQPVGKELKTSCV